MAEEASLMGLVDRLETEADAYKYLEELRWPEGDPVCPHCGNDAGNYFLAPSDGTRSRKTRTGAQTMRRVWKCRSCRRQFSAITDTVMHGTKVSLRKWCFVIYEMWTAKNGISAREVQRKYNVAPKTAWHMLHRIREAMRNDPVIVPMSGRVASDETRIGGKWKNKSKAERSTPVPYTAGEGVGDAGKSTVLSLIHEESAEVRYAVIPDVTGSSLRKAIAEQVDLAETVLITDEWKAYKTIGVETADHQTVNHSAEEYVRYEGDTVISTNVVEGYFSQLKRSIDGTHHHVSSTHLPQFDYLYSTRGQTDGERMKGLMGRVGGRRLTCRPSQSPT